MADTSVNNWSQLKSQLPSNHACQLGDRIDNFRGPAEFPLALGDWASANPYPCLTKIYKMKLHTNYHKGLDLLVSDKKILVLPISQVSQFLYHAKKHNPSI